MVHIPVNYNLDLKEDERCFYHGALGKTRRPMCFGVTDQALFVLREKFLRIEAYSMCRIPLDQVKDVVLSRDRGAWMWIKAGTVFGFGLISIIVMSIGQAQSPNSPPNLLGVYGPLIFIAVGVMIWKDSNWRLVLTIRTTKKNYRWRPHIFDKRDEVKLLQESFLGACRYIEVRTHRLDLVNEREISNFWKWFEGHVKSGKINTSRVQEKLHKVCDRIDIEFGPERPNRSREMIITANYAADAFPIVEEIVFAAPAVQGWSVKAFRPRQNINGVYRFGDTDHPLDGIFFVPYTDGFELAVEICAESKCFEDSGEVLWALYKDLIGEYDTVFGVRYVQFKELSEVNDPSVLRHISQLSEYVDDFHHFEVS